MIPHGQFSTITEMFDDLTERFLHDHRPVLMYKSEGKYRKISYAVLRKSVDDFAQGLAVLGVHRGDAIALISENRPEWVIADMGMMKLGAINVSLYPTLTPKQIEFIFNDAGVRFAIVSNRFQLSKIMKIRDAVPSLQIIIILSDKNGVSDPALLTYGRVIEMGKEFGKHHTGYLRDETKKIHADDILTIIYTSGTTGNPKGVVLTHRNLVSNINAAAACIPFNHHDTLLSFLPLCHSYERMAGYYTAMLVGATIAYAESIETVRENLLDVKPTVVTTVPRLFERMYNKLMTQVDDMTPFEQRIFRWAIGIGTKYRSALRSKHFVPFLSVQQALADRLVFKKIRARMGGNIRFFASGGAALSKEMGEFFESVGIQIIEGYGMTESSPVISVNRLDDYKFGTVGKPIPDVHVRIAEDGEILVQGPNVMKGYWNNPQATGEAIDREGWLHTGDIGHFDEDGFLTVTDRKKHLFVSSGGKNIAPQHIENLFLQNRFVDQFILIGDGRMFLTSLIVPDFTAVKEYAVKHHIDFDDEDDLAAKPEIYKLFENEMAVIQKDLANYERVRKFTILRHPLTIEDGEITPTMKIRRKVVEERYKDVIAKMYENVR